MIKSYLAVHRKRPRTFSWPPVDSPDGDEFVSGMRSQRKANRALTDPTLEP
jgi:hypothetical protein